MQSEESRVGESQGNAAIEWVIWRDRVEDKDVRARSPGISIKFENTIFSASLRCRVLGTVRKSCSAKQDNVRAAQKPTTREKIFAPRGGEKI